MPNQHGCYHRLRSNSLIQVSIADLAVLIFSSVGRPRITIESALPTLPRASFSAAPLDRLKTTACLAFTSVAKTADLGAASDSALIAFIQPSIATLALPIRVGVSRLASSAGIKLSNALPTFRRALSSAASLENVVARATRAALRRIFKISL